MTCDNLVYPATTNQQAIDLNIHNSNQFHILINGSVTDEIETCEGNGNLPSWAKALNERATYKTPLAWQIGVTETDLTQPRVFDDQIYVPLRTPALMDTSPDNNWSLYSYTQIIATNAVDFVSALATDFSASNTVNIAQFSSSQNPGKGGFVGVKTGSVGTPSSGNCLQWYDALGNEFILSTSLLPNPYMFGVNDNGSDQTAEINSALDAVIASTNHSVLYFPIPTVAWGIDAWVPPAGSIVVGESREETVFLNTSTNSGILAANDDTHLFNFSVDGNGQVSLGVSSNSDFEMDQIKTKNSAGCIISGDDATIGTWIEEGSGTSSVTIDGDRCSIQRLYGLNTRFITNSAIKGLRIQELFLEGPDSTGSALLDLNGLDGGFIDNIYISTAMPTGERAAEIATSYGGYIGRLSLDLTLWTNNTPPILFSGYSGGLVVDSLSVNISGSANFESTSIVEFTNSYDLSLNRLYVFDNTSTDAGVGTRFVTFPSDNTNYFLGKVDGSKYVRGNAARAGSVTLIPDSMDYEFELDGVYSDPFSTVTPIFEGQKIRRVAPDPGDGTLGNSLSVIQVWEAYSVNQGDWQRITPDPRIQYVGEPESSFGYEITISPSGTAAGGDSGREFDTFNNAFNAMPRGIPTTINLLAGTTSITSGTLLPGDTLTIVNYDTSNPLTVNDGQSLNVSNGATLTLRTNDFEVGDSRGNIVLFGGEVRFEAYQGSPQTFTCNGASTDAVVNMEDNGVVNFRSTVSFSTRTTAGNIVDLSLQVDSPSITYPSSVTLGVNWNQTFSHGFRSVWTGSVSNGVSDLDILASTGFVMRAGTYTIVCEDPGGGDDLYLSLVVSELQEGNFNLAYIDGSDIISTQWQSTSEFYVFNHGTASNITIFEIMYHF